MQIVADLLLPMDSILHLPSTVLLMHACSDVYVGMCRVHLAFGHCINTAFAQSYGNIRGRDSATWSLVCISTCAKITVTKRMCQIKVGHTFENVFLLLQTIRLDLISYFIVSLVSFI